MKKWMFYILDIILFLFFVIIGVTGLLIYPGLLPLFGFNLNSLPKFYIYEAHHWIGLALLVLASIHIDLHWKWLKTMTKKWLKPRHKKRKHSRRSSINYVVDVFLIFSFILVFVTGIMKFRGFTAWTHIDPRILPLYEISLIHDNAGLLALLFTGAHFALHLKWFKTTTQRIGAQLKARLYSKKKVSISILFVVLLGVTLLFVFQQYLFTSSPVYSTDGDHQITIEGVGTFSYLSTAIPTIRKDLFNSSSYSIYAILEYLDSQGAFSMNSYFDESMNTFVIDDIDGKKHWWYEAYYSGGWPEDNVYRIDHFPFKEQITIRLYQTTEEHIQSIYQVFLEEIQRYQSYENTTVIPRVVIETPSETLEFFNVEITAHNKRPDLFQEGIITALDVIISLGDQQAITYELNWYTSIGSAEVVQNYFVDAINDEHSIMRCGYIYESGSYTYQGFSGNHIHIPADARIIHAPEYVFWFWTCL